MRNMGTPKWVVGVSVILGLLIFASGGLFAGPQAKQPIRLSGESLDDLKWSIDTSCLDNSTPEKTIESISLLEEGLSRSPLLEEIIRKGQLALWGMLLEPGYLERLAQSRLPTGKKEVPSQPGKAGPGKGEPAEVGPGKGAPPKARRGKARISSSKKLPDGRLQILVERSGEPPFGDSMIEQAERIRYTLVKEDGEWRIDREETPCIECGETGKCSECGGKRQGEACETCAGKGICPACRGEGYVDSGPRPPTVRKDFPPAPKAFDLSSSRKAAESYLKATEAQKILWLKLASKTADLFWLIMDRLYSKGYVRRLKTEKAVTPEGPKGKILKVKEEAPDKALAILSFALPAPPEGEDEKPRTIAITKRIRLKKIEDCWLVTEVAFECLLCNGTGKCMMCQGTGKFFGDRCDICGGAGTCQECSGRSSIPAKDLQGL